MPLDHLFFSHFLSPPVLFTQQQSVQEVWYIEYHAGCWGNRHQASGPWWDFQLTKGSDAEVQGATRTTSSMPMMRRGWGQGPRTQCQAIGDGLVRVLISQGFLPSQARPAPTFSFASLFSSRAALPSSLAASTSSKSHLLVTVSQLPKLPCRLLWDKPSCSTISPQQPCISLAPTFPSTKWCLVNTH